MFNIQLLDNLSPTGLSQFPSDLYTLSTECANPDALLVRSRKLHDFNFAPSVKAVGRAGVGTDNIPVEKLTQQGIPVFYAPGANANAVKELVLAAILIGYRRLDNARQFMLTLSAEEEDAELGKKVEKEKKQFVGHEILGKCLGVLGLGHIGVKVANAALALGMRVIAFDPNISVDNALALMPGVTRLNRLEEILAQVDVLSIHVPLLGNTHHLINEDNIHLLKPKTLLLNFSRADIVSEAAVLDALASQHLLGYITDFPTASLASHPDVLSFPHLGASTVEAEENSAALVVNNIRGYLEFGHIKNAVNFPNVTLPFTGNATSQRLIIINENIPGVIATVSQSLSQSGHNIEQMLNQSLKTVAYNLIDIEGSHANNADMVAKIKNLPGVLRVNLLNIQ